MRKILTILLALGVSFSFAQKNNTKKKTQNAPTKNAPATPSIEKEENYLPVQFIKAEPIKRMDEKFIDDLRNRGYEISYYSEMPLDENNSRFMYDYLVEEKDEKEFLISPDGKEELLPRNLKFINVFKDGSKLFSDKCIEYSEVDHCPNLKIVSKNGETKNILSEYRFLIGVGHHNSINLNEKSFTIIHHHKTLNANLMDETGKILLDKDVEDINYLFPPYVSVKEDNQIKIYHLLERKFLDFKSLEFTNVLPHHKLFILKVPNAEKYKVVEHDTQKVLFESDKPEIVKIGKENYIARDFFKVYLGKDVERVINRSGKILFEDKAIARSVMDNGNIFVFDTKMDKKNEYSPAEKKYLFPRFFEEVNTSGIFQYVKYNKYYEVKNIKTGEILYTEDDHVQSYGTLGNLVYINRTYQTAPNAYSRGVNDIYTKDGELIFKEKNGFNRLSDHSDDYFQMENEKDFSIIDKDGKMVVPSLYIPNFIKFNRRKKIFELMRKREKVAPYECYNLEGNKVECK